MVKVNLPESRRALVVSDPEILGGDVVFRGTRVSVHLIQCFLSKETRRPRSSTLRPRLFGELQLAQSAYDHGIEASRGGLEQHTINAERVLALHTGIVLTTPNGHHDWR